MSDSKETLKDMTIKQRNPLLDDVAQLLQTIGVCPCCGEIIQFDPDTPIASCGCGDMEWTSDPTLIEQIRRIEAKIPRDI